MANAPRNLWGRDILEEMGTVITTDVRAFYEEVLVHNNIGLSGHKEKGAIHPQF